MKDTAERVVKLMEDFYSSKTVEKEKTSFVTLRARTCKD